MRARPGAQLAAQGNELLGEMKELLRQQQEEVASCRAALARSEQVSRQLELEGGERERASIERADSCVFGNTENSR